MYATRQTMTKYSHYWLRSEETFDYDHFLTYNESEERKEFRIHSFSQLLAQLQTPTSLTTFLINGLKLAYQEHYQPTSQPSPPEQNVIRWNRFIRGRISTDLTKTITKNGFEQSGKHRRF